VAQDKPRTTQQGIAHVPSTVLTVEYVDDSEGMDAAIKGLAGRVQKMEELLSGLQDRHGRLVSAVNQQAKELSRYIESIGRRIDQIYKRIVGTDVGTNHGAATAAANDEELDEAAPSPQSPSVGLSANVAEDPEHQNAWRVARVLAADLEAYHEDSVMEGVLYGTFFKVLHEPIEKARKTYEERVPREIVENYDYFSKALDELIARKRMELDTAETS